MDDFQDSRTFTKYQRNPREQKEYMIALQHGVTQHLLRDELNIQEEDFNTKSQQIK